ncbi:hypothetical protein EJP82_06470 [Paenibacillus anaericanus]|uniref:Uncharacterized protein n=1 Tax=Paenibacillus anaericanus TaxID=170367 RepID=A0A433YBX8_9BACL|nr:hypothetical protein [Paenibacillus anaericanus]RUT47353.1 hypothetical protein EJP82_06470 [Paenibacillus anaericanus]
MNKYKLRILLLSSVIICLVLIPFAISKSFAVEQHDTEGEPQPQYENLHPFHVTDEEYQEIKNKVKHILTSYGDFIRVNEEQPFPTSEIAYSMSEINENTNQIILEGTRIFVKE